jgi:hypothetical protein
MVAIQIRGRVPTSGTDRGLAHLSGDELGRAGAVKKQAMVATQIRGRVPTSGTDRGLAHLSGDERVVTVGQVGLRKRRA